jgi:hypothetical protein
MQNKTARTELTGQDCQKRADRTGLPAQSSQNRTARIRQPGQDRKERTARTKQLEQDSQNEKPRNGITVTGTGQAEQDCQHMTLMTVLLRLSIEGRKQEISL